MGNGDGESGTEGEPIVSCDLNGGTLSVYADHVTIERTSASMFEDKTIDVAEIRGVNYAPGIVSGHIQIEQEGVDADEGGLLSHPVDENTLFLARTQRACVRRARDAILERAGGSGTP